MEGNRSPVILYTPMPYTWAKLCRRAPPPVPDDDVSDLPGPHHALAGEGGDVVVMRSVASMHSVERVMPCAMRWAPLLASPPRLWTPPRRAR